MTASLAPHRPASALAAMQSAADRAAALLRPLAHADRLVLLCALAAGERCVTELASATGIRQPTLSQQLGVLREQGLVAARRDGRFVHYRVASPAALELLGLLQRLYCPGDATAGPPVPRRARPAPARTPTDVER